MLMTKHIRLTGCSNISWKDAIVKAVNDVSKTIRNLEGLTVLEQTAKIQDDKIIEYYVLLEITFSIDEDIRIEKSENK